MGFISAPLRQIAQTVTDDLEQSAYLKKLTWMDVCPAIPGVKFLLLCSSYELVLSGITCQCESFHEAGFMILFYLFFSRKKRKKMTVGSHVGE